MGKRYSIVAMGAGYICVVNEIFILNSFVRARYSRTERMKCKEGIWVLYEMCIDLQPINISTCLKSDRQIQPRGNTAYYCLRHLYHDVPCATRLKSSCGVLLGITSVLPGAYRAPE